jgi:branched-chain amino acid transport system substrate-binding protein
MTATSRRRSVHLSRRQALAGGLALAALPLPVVRTEAAAPIRIGFPTALTGPYKEEALDQVRAAKVAIAMFNEQGGLHGRQAELLVRDDKLDPGVAIVGTQELIDKEKVDFIVGGLSASVQLAINDICRQRKVLFNSISQSDAIVAAPYWSRYTFHEALTPHMTAGTVGRYVFPKFGKRVAFLTADYAYGLEMVRGFQAVGGPLGIEVVADIRHALGTTDFTPFLTLIKQLKPDVLLLCNFGRDQQLSIVQADKLGLKQTTKLVAPVLLYTTRKTVGSKPFEGVMGGTSYYWRLEDDLASANTFNRRFRAMNEGRVPTSYGALGFGGVAAVLRAVTDAGSTETDKVIGALEALKYDLYKGPQYFRGCDHQSVQSALVVESRATTNPNDMDVFSIVHIEPADGANLQSCADLGHA